MSSQLSKVCSHDQSSLQWQTGIDSLVKSTISLVATTTSHVVDENSTQQLPICNGRVKSLETMVKPQWWKTVFADAMYLKTDGDVVEDADITKSEVAMLEAMPEIKQILMRGCGSESSDNERNPKATCIPIAQSPSSLDPPSFSGKLKPFAPTPSPSIECGGSKPSTPISLGKPARILDLCCGQGRHALYLAKEYPQLYVHGHDQSSYLISLARERASLQKVSSQTTFTVGDCRQIPYPGNTFDLVLVMGNSFGYFSNEDEDHAVLAEIERVLAPEGRIVLDLTDGEFMRNNFSERGWEWVDDSTFVCRERQLSRDRLRLISREIITMSNKGVVRDQFYQERLYSKTELNHLFVEAGMVVSENSSGPDGDGVFTMAFDLNKRQEDVGMMAQRMLITASKPRSSVSSTATAHDRSAVVDGDATEIAATNSSDDTSSFGISVVAGSSETCSNLVGSVGDLVENLDELATMSSSLTLLPFESITVLMGDTSIACVGKLNNAWNDEDMATRKRLIDALYDMGYTEKQIRIVENHSSLVHVLSEKDMQFVLNLCDEGYRNDALMEMHVPALLDIANVQYSGAGPNCLAFCYDKGLVNGAAHALGVPVPREMTYLSDASTSAIPNLEKLDQLIRENIFYPAFIKPIKGDNSLGITCRSVIHNQNDLSTYMDELATMGIRNVLVQEYLTGIEYGVGMVGNTETGFHFFPTLKVDYSKIIAKNLEPILGFESKWDPSSPYWSDISYEAANLPSVVDTELQKTCVVLWERFGCRDYARFDFRCDVGRGDGTDDLGGTIKLLEVNPNPGWCWDGKLAYMAKLEGLDYKDMLRMILQAACDRIVHAHSLSSQ
ncbi:hypothetical protein BASA50_000040 [Batrachochytrium salamandrivorans]|uniref:ATP-grasp domain-containing protein n=1 Tax=Batrachochytrium salamandrivorans TaxID=1357716 RepID=A0ABQ8EUX3_9FUNG|nr:hypothetical protein BASA50_000040 [Batrachochytrium salamandrivorans]KAH6601283.1 hypothetical protein BASA61_002053 [Batrachochytrium salamandrivorans]KAH9271593.1 hypothetical protein BASA83_006203 [Batrachochytrium salamandrivorans]